MNRFGAIVWRALNRSRRLAPGLVPAGHWPLAALVAAASLLSTFAASATVHAENPPDPAARLQVVINKIHIIDDTDWIGNGNESFSAELCAGDSAGPDADAYTCGGAATIYYDHSFNAGSGDDINLDRVVPLPGDHVQGDASVEAGLPVYAGHHYLFVADMIDRDPLSPGDAMGGIAMHLNQENQWGLGTHTIRSLKQDAGGYSDGDYELTFEIREAPLPDFWFRGTRELQTEDGHFYCVQVENIGQQPVGPTPLSISLNGEPFKSTELKELGVNETTGYCLLRSDLPALQLEVTFTVDPARQIPEMNDRNDSLVLSIPASAPAGVAPDPLPSPSPSPSAGVGDPSGGAEASGHGADLTVRSILVNGQAPDGKNDCKPGKNSVNVVVKNVGKADAEGFTVRLTVDDSGLDMPVGGLGAGQERDVHFDTIQLKAGAHTLRAVADPSHAGADPKEGNNELKSTAHCGSGG